eukprot:CAMPEP_0115297674 /NCGR_PEP_ID=MMETSP0270-20121206/67874_1 /TAXON_ID=71861 /ORGANISM="Scrippsiella trochoidea, Strain CCMP3099" /LENGTH=63 /DNA_ID=CAMNT_0002715347 /DNA_START=93 /DNA_END=282 /DNA_ORIENTATION=+
MRPTLHAECKQPSVLEIEKQRPIKAASGKNYWAPAAACRYHAPLPNAGPLAGPRAALDVHRHT